MRLKVARAHTRPRRIESVFEIAFTRPRWLQDEATLNEASPETALGTRITRIVDSHVLAHAVAPPGLARTRAGDERLERHFSKKELICCCSVGLDTLSIGSSTGCQYLWTIKKKPQ